MSRNLAALVLLNRVQNGESSGSVSQGFNSRANPPNQTTGDYLQTMVAAKGIAGIPERLESGDITSIEAGHLMSTNVGLLLELGGLDGINSDRHALHRPGTVALEGQTFEGHPFLGYLSEAINMGISEGQQPFTPSSLAALQLDIIRGTFDEVVNSAASDPMPARISRNHYDFGVGGQLLRTGHSVSLVQFDTSEPFVIGSHASREFDVPVEHTHHTIHRYLPHDERIELITGLDEATYSQAVYNGYVSHAQNNLGDLEKMIENPLDVRQSLGMAYGYGQSATIYFDLSIEALRDLEPGLNDEAYQKRVMSDLNIDKSVHEFVPQAISEMKDHLVESLNDYIRSTAAVLRGCETAIEVKSLGEYLSFRLQRINDQIMNLQPNRHIPYDTQFEGELLQQIKERAEEIGIIADEPGWRLGLRTLDGNVDACEPLAIQPILAPAPGNQGQPQAACAGV